MKFRATYAYSSQLWDINHLQVANLISKQYTELILLKNNPENIKILQMVRYMYERTKRERKKRTLHIVHTMLQKKRYKRTIFLCESLLFYWVVVVNTFPLSFMKMLIIELSKLTKHIWTVYILLGIWYIYRKQPDTSPISYITHQWWNLLRLL